MLRPARFEKFCLSQRFWKSVALSLSLVSCVVAGPALAIDYEVTTLADDLETDIGTFRWAVAQVNANDTGLDRIIFAQALLPQADADDVLNIFLNSAPLAITVELQIVAPTDLTPDPDVNYAVNIEDADGNFNTSESLILRNVNLNGASLTFNGGTKGASDTIDLVYDLSEDTITQDVLGNVQDGNSIVPVVDPGRVVKLGRGELAFLTGAGSRSGGILLVDGTFRTDSFAVFGEDIQICADGLGADVGYTSATCDETLLIFEMPSLSIDPDAPRGTVVTNGNFNGNISSEAVGGENGKVVKTGIGRLSLTGENTYQGGTYIMEGNLTGDVDSVQGDIYICPDVVNIIKASDPDGLAPIACSLEERAELTIGINDDEVDAIFAGEVHGGGLFQKAANTVLTINNDQLDFHGELLVSEGTLVMNGDVGTLGDSTTEVDVTVANGATFTGTGTINGDVDVQSGGTLSGGPDLGPGPLTIALNLDVSGTVDLTDQNIAGTTARIRNGAVIKLDPAIAGGPGTLSLSSTLTLNGGAVDVDFDPDEDLALLNGFFTVAESDVALDGELTGGQGGSGILNQIAIFNLELRYNDGVNCTGAFNICLSSSFDPDLTDDAVTKNQRGIAGALGNAYECAQDPNMPGCGISDDTADDFNQVFGNFTVPVDEVPGVLDQMASEEFAAFSDVRIAGASRFNRSISRRFDLELNDFASPDDSDASQDTEGEDASSLPGPPQPADVSATGTRWKALGGNSRTYRDYRRDRMERRQGKQREPMSMDRHAGRGGLTGWLDIHGVMGEVGGSENADDVKYRIYGPLFGVDYGLTENITVGVTAGYTRNEIQTKGSNSKGTGNSYQGGVYAGAVFDDFYLTGAVRYAYTDLETRREIRFGNLNRTATGDFDASDVTAFFEAAYDIPVPGTIVVQPLIAVAYNSLSQSSFNENNADSLNLEIAKQDYDALQTSVGVRLALFGRDGEGRYLLPQLRIAYEREWLDKDRTVDANLPSAGDGGEFELVGLEVPRDRAVIGVSTEVGLSDIVNVFIDYDLRASKELLEHSLAFGMRAVW